LAGDTVRSLVRGPCAQGERVHMLAPRPGQPLDPTMAGQPLDPTMVGQPLDPAMAVGQQPFLFQYNPGPPFDLGVQQHPLHLNPALSLQHGGHLPLSPALPLHHGGHIPLNPQALAMQHGCHLPLHPAPALRHGGHPAPTHLQPPPSETPTFILNDSRTRASCLCCNITDLCKQSLQSHSTGKKHAKAHAKLFGVAPDPSALTLSQALAAISEVEQAAQEERTAAKVAQAAQEEAAQAAKAEHKAAKAAQHAARAAQEQVAKAARVAQEQAVKAEQKAAKAAEQAVRAEQEQAAKAAKAARIEQEQAARAARAAQEQAARAAQQEAAKAMTAVAGRYCELSVQRASKKLRRELQLRLCGLELPPEPLSCDTDELQWVVQDIMKAVASEPRVPLPDRQGGKAAREPSESDDPPGKRCKASEPDDEIVTG